MNKKEYVSKLLEHSQREVIGMVVYDAIGWINRSNRAIDLLALLHEDNDLGSEVKELIQELETSMAEMTVVITSLHDYQEIQDGHYGLDTIT